MIETGRYGFFYFTYFWQKPGRGSLRERVSRRKSP